MTTQSFNPRTGKAFGPEIADTSASQVELIIDKAVAAFEKWSAATALQRAEALMGIADALDANSTSLVEIADLETGLGLPRLTGEIGRTTFQLREFARTLIDGRFIKSEVDAFADAPLPAGHPELIRSLSPLGVVVVFGANNFPFAFSVLGGDTASALAAGCAVIAKAHPSHPQTSNQVFAFAQQVLAAQGFNDALTLIHGVEAGVTVLNSPKVSAGAFTGSRRGGRALFDIAQSRETPIPFYGELGSVNPVIILNSAITDASALASAYLDSLLLGNGQFCTNPSILLVPAKSPMLTEIERQILDRKPTPFLSPGTKSAHDSNRLELAKLLGSAVVHGQEINDGGLYSAPAILVTNVASVLAQPRALEIECFGPTGLVITYENVSELLKIIANLEGALTGSVFSATTDPDAVTLCSALARKVGRLSWNSWPTGVAVTIGQHHGGPYPASTSPIHTSVGLHAIVRFLRPVSYQNFPAEIAAKL